MGPLLSVCERYYGYRLATNFSIIFEIVLFRDANTLTVKTL